MDPSPALELSVGPQPTSLKSRKRELRGGEDEEMVIGELRKKIRTLNEENRHLSEELSTVLASFEDLKRQSLHLVGERNRSRKESTTLGDVVNHVEEKRFTKVYVKSNPWDAANLGVKDGYQWRKYGQKVTRDNPYPRAYFKCSFSPSCPVKKKVQRSLEDKSLLVAIYEGEHNHPPSPVKLVVAHELLSCNSPPLPPPPSSSPTSLQEVETTSDSRRCDLLDSSREFSVELGSHLAKNMASRLASDPNFTQQLVNLILLRPQ